MAGVSRGPVAVVTNTRPDRHGAGRGRGNGTEKRVEPFARRGRREEMIERGRRRGAECTEPADRLSRKMLTASKTEFTCL